MEEDYSGGGGWLGFATQAFGTAATVTTNLVTAGQQNRTNRELSLEQMDNAGDLQLMNASLSGQNKNIMLIGILAVVVIFAAAFAFRMAK